MPKNTYVYSVGTLVYLTFDQFIDIPKVIDSVIS